MNSESQKWFDYAYELLDGGLIPFGTLTHNYDVNEVKLMFKNRYERTISEEDAQQFWKVFQHYVKKLPSAEDFREEKMRVLDALIPILQKNLSLAQTAIMFGTLRGDIDIALLSPEGITEEYICDAISRDISKKYPIVDWDALFYFRSKDGEDVATKLIQSRFEGGLTEISPNEKKYLQETANTAKLLWGNPQELVLMRSTLEGRLLPNTN